MVVALGSTWEAVWATFYIFFLLRSHRNYLSQVWAGILGDTHTQLPLRSHAGEASESHLGPQRDSGQHSRASCLAVITDAPFQHGPGRAVGWADTGDAVCSPPQGPASASRM